MLNSHFWTEPEWVTENRIQEIFNACQYYERVMRGELHQRNFGFDNHLTRRQREKIHEPRCTRSQMVLYFTPEGLPVALVHQYRRKSGEIGGSGLPDPKRIFISGRIIAVRQSP